MLASARRGRANRRGRATRSRANRGGRHYRSVPHGDARYRESASRGVLRRGLDLVEWIVGVGRLAYAIGGGGRTQVRCCAAAISRTVDAQIERHSYNDENYNRDGRSRRYRTCLSAERIPEFHGNLGFAHQLYAKLQTTSENS